MLREFKANPLYILPVYQIITKITKHQNKISLINIRFKRKLLLQFHSQNSFLEALVKKCQNFIHLRNVDFHDPL